MRLTTVPDRPVSQIVAGRLVARRGLPALYWPLVQVPAPWPDHAPVLLRGAAQPGCPAVAEFELAAQGP
jgi:hypothetical protein